MDVIVAMIAAPFVGLAIGLLIAPIVHGTSYRETWTIFKRKGLGL